MAHEASSGCVCARPLHGGRALSDPSYPHKDILDRMMNAIVEIRADVRSVQSDVSQAMHTQSEMQGSLAEVKVKVASLTAVIPEALNIRLDRIEQDRERQGKYVGAAMLAAIGALGTTAWNLLTKGHQ